jgi:tripartite-type tricarboxylate transporter receptor subunit TctC
MEEGYMSYISRVVLVVIASCCGLAPLFASAQTFPTKPIRIIVPYPPGGGVDIIARTVANRMSETIGQQVLVDNRAGGGTVIGTELVARAPADGYTLLLTNIAFGANPALQKKLPYDSEKDLVPVCLAALLPSFLVVHPSLPVKSVKELISFVKTRPGQLNFGSSGVATGTHLSMELFMHMTGLKMVHIPYKGGSLNVNALIAGETQVNFSTISTALQHVKTGRLRALAVSTAKRAAAAPEIPTVNEAGLAGYDYSSWIGLLAPAKTPANIIARLNTESNKAVHTSEVKAILATEASEAVGTTPEEFDVIMKREVARWMQVVKAAGIKGE